METVEEPFVAAPDVLGVMERDSFFTRLNGTDKRDEEESVSGRRKHIVIYR